MHVNFFNSTGKIDLGLIDAVEVEKLNAKQQEFLSHLVEAAQSREAASARADRALDRVRDLMAEEVIVLAAHREANPPVDRIEALRENQQAFNARLRK